MPYKRKYNRKRTYGKKKYAKKSKKTVSKKQVKTIVKTVMNNQLESKYFNTTTINQLTQSPNLVRTGGRMGCLGFAIGTGRINEYGAIMSYGVLENGAGSPVTALNCARVFTDSTQESAQPQFHLEGNYANPALCRTEWILQRPMINTSTSRDAAKKALPMFIRMIRVSPRILKYGDVSIDPQRDLFVDQYGQATGVAQGGFDELEIQMFKINSRKYSVLEDKQLILNTPMTTSLFNIDDGNTQVTNLGNTSRTHFTRNHKQPAKLYYKSLENQPSAGQSNEFIFFHFMLLGGYEQYNLTTRAEIDVYCKPVATFKDA